MSRYIDAEKLKANYLWWHEDERKIIDDIVDAQPTADVAEVVRCKDCKWRDNEGGAERCTHKYGGMWAKSDGYCSYGERAEV